MGLVLDQIGNFVFSQLLKSYLKTLFYFSYSQSAVFDLLIIELVPQQEVPFPQHCQIEQTGPLVKTVLDCKSE